MGKHYRHEDPGIHNRAMVIIIIAMLLMSADLSFNILDIHNGRVFEREQAAAANSFAAANIITTAPYISINAVTAATAHDAVIEANRWKGPVLSKGRGVNNGPSGKETYYNLNMSIVVKMMNRMGYDYEYWVRDDGVKMFGDYVMIAANLDLRPKGTLVETSLGTGMVCDTGGFAKRNPTQIDIATSW